MLIDMASLLFLLLAVFLAITGFAVRIRRRRPKNRGRWPPPSPPKLPLVGNLHQLGKYPQRTLATLAKRYGPLTLFHIGSKPVLVATTSAAARELLKTHDLVSSGRPQFDTANKLLYGDKDMANSSYGEYWRQARRLCVLHLLSNRKVLSGRAVRKEEIGLLVDRVGQSARERQEVNLSELLLCLANDIICKLSLGRKYDENNNFKDLLAEFNALLGGFSVGDFIPSLSWVNRLTGFDSRVDAVSRQFDKLLDAAIVEGAARLEKQRDTARSVTSQEEEEEKQLTPFIDILLQLQKDNHDHQLDDDEFHLDTDGVKALILDMFVGATDTTSILMEWAMSELMKHPRVMKKLQEEVRREAGQGVGGVGEGDLDRMEYLKLVIKETIRLHPPLPLLLPRQVMEDANIMGYDVPSGTMILINAWAIGRDPADWTESPEEFWPERFLTSNVDFRGQDFELLPFSAGRRGCPGVSFGLAIAELALAQLVCNFDWELPGGTEGQELDMTESVGFTTHRHHPLVVIPSMIS